MRTGGHGIVACAQRGVGVQLLAEVIEEPERRSRERCEGRRISVAETHQERGVAVAAGQRIGHHVRLAGPVLNPEIIPEQFAHPVMLWNCRKPLVEHELEGVVISPDDESAPQR